MSNAKEISKLANEELDTVNEHGLNARQEAFARYYWEENNASVAYRRAYNVSRGVKPAWVWSAASSLYAEPKVRARINHFKDEAAKQAVCGIADLMRFFFDIATADPRELVRIERRNCRYCNGANFAFQWKDAQEYSLACAKAIEDALKSGSGTVIPDFDGGVGFNPLREPHIDCPQCFGEGHETVKIADTHSLGPKARKLYAGAEMDRFGCIKVRMHDQAKAAEQLVRMLGGFNDKVRIDDMRPAGGSGEAKATIMDSFSPEDAAKAYRELLRR